MSSWLLTQASCAPKDTWELGDQCLCILATFLAALLTICAPSLAQILLIEGFLAASSCNNPALLVAHLYAAFLAAFLLCATILAAIILLAAFLAAILALCIFPCSNSFCARMCSSACCQPPKVSHTCMPRRLLLRRCVAASFPAPALWL